MNRRQALVAFGLAPIVIRRKAEGWIIPVICTVAILGVGVYVGYQVYRLCKKINAQKPVDVDDPDAPPQDKPNFLQPKPGTPPQTSMKLTDDSGVLYYDATGYGFYDCNGEQVTGIMQTRLQSTADFQTWTDEIKMIGYCAASGMTVVVTRAAVKIATFYLAMGQTNAFDLNLGGTMTPHKFYRLAAP